MAAVADAAPKPKKPGDSKLVAALQDVRLKGSGQAVYFTLRGLGMPATEGPGAIPRIEIYAAKQPQLFAALRRLGLRRDGNRIVVEAKEDPPTDRAVTAPIGSPLGSADARRPHGMQSSDGFNQGATASSFRSRRSNLTHEEHEDFFANMAFPKVMARKEAYYHAMTEFAIESGYFGNNEDKPNTPPMADLTRSASTPNARQQAVVEDEWKATPTPSPKSGTVALPQLSSSSSSCYKPSKPRAKPADQQAWCARSAVPRVQRSKVDLTFSTYRVQSSVGRASERDFLRRAAVLKEHQQMQEAERQRAAAFLDGSIPPEPSLASLGPEGSTGGEVSRKISLAEEPDAFELAELTQHSAQEAFGEQDMWGTDEVARAMMALEQQDTKGSEEVGDLEQVPIAT